MVDRLKLKIDSCGACGCMMEDNNDGAYVTFYDYEAIAKERDEWKKRCVEEGEETARLFEERDELKAENLKLTEFYNKFGNLQPSEMLQVKQLKAKLDRLVETATPFVLTRIPNGIDIIPVIFPVKDIDKLKAAIEAAKVKP